MILKECMLVENLCYKDNVKMNNNKPTGIVVHSTGANNPYLKRYVQPVEKQPYYYEIMDDLGTNIYNNHWNMYQEKMSDRKCVHAFIGLNRKNVIETIQTLPYDVCCWGCGSGSKGSYNYNPNARIQFEICEDDLTNESYFYSVMKEAQEYCAYLCTTFNLPIESICSHAESYINGYGSNHSDCDHWLKKFGKTMWWFREQVKKIIENGKTDNTADVFYRVQVGAYNDYNNAVKMKDKLKSAGFEGFIVKVERNK